MLYSRCCLFSFLFSSVICMIMTATHVPPKHIQQGAEAVLGEAPAKIVVIRVSPVYAVHVAWRQSLTRSEERRVGKGCRYEVKCSYRYIHCQLVVVSLSFVNVVDGEC